MPKHKKTRRKAPRGYHYMPDGRLMKNSAHKKKKRKKKWMSLPVQPETLYRKDFLDNERSLSSKSWKV